MALAACTEAPRHPALKNASLPPLLQASRFAPIAPEAGDYRLSPDGRKLAWIAPWLGRSTLHVRNLASGETRRLGRLAQTGQWTPDSRWLVFASHAGSEDTHVYAFDTLAAGEPLDLTPYRGVKARIHQVDPSRPASLLVAHNRRDARLFDLYRIDLATHTETLVAANPGDAVAPLTGSGGELRGWQRSREAKRTPEERRMPLAARRARMQEEPPESVRALGMSRDGETLWAISNRGRDRAALVSVHPRFGWERVEFEDPHVDILDVDMSALTRSPLIVRAVPGEPVFKILDERLRADLEGLVRTQGNEPVSLEIASADAREETLVVLVRSAANRRYYLVDRQTRAHQLLSQALPAQFEAAMAPRTAVVITASDGVALRGYLTLPQGVAAKRLPLVLHVHGGPWQRTGWGDALASEESLYAQFLANRGYAVLQVDFRGSTGYGKRLLYAGAGEFGGRMQQDLLDAARWAVERGIADAASIGIVGWSYGGYAALVALTSTPREFACAISLNGPTELASLIESFPAYWRTDLSMWHDFVGNPSIAEDRAEMLRRSPLTHAASAERPALIIQGARDVRVRVDQAERMVAALRAAGKPVEYLRIEDMGHGAGWWVHRLQVLRATEAFLGGCLGGRASGFDPWEPVAALWSRLQR